MKLQKIILSFTIALVSILSSYGQAGSTYTFATVQKSDLNNGVFTNTKTFGQRCTLDINSQENTYTFTFKSMEDRINFKVVFKVTGATAEVVGDDSPQKTIFNVVNKLDTDGSIQFIPKPNPNRAFVYSFLK